MHLTFVTFNYQSADLEAEERNYLGHHVQLARRFPGLRQYYTGRLMRVAGKEPDRVRAAILGYDDAAAASTATRSDVVPALLGDTQAHLTDGTSTAVDAETIVAFDSRRVGQPCFVMVAEFDLELDVGIEAAEKHYLGTHVSIARSLPGLRNYIIGKLIKAPGIDDSRYRMATLVFDSLNAYRAAYASTAGCVYSRTKRLRFETRAYIGSTRESKPKYRSQHPMLPRSAGILIPLFSIRTRDNLGRGEILDLAPMIDFALSMGHRVIQLLPLDETGPDDLSPYSAMSVMAIDPTYISMGGLPGVGRVVLARARDAIGRRRFVERPIIRREKFPLLERAYRASRARGGRDEAAQLDAFIEANSYWIHDYALFRALKDRFNWTSWETWPAEIAKRDPTALTLARRELADAIEMYGYWQYLAHRQWSETRAYASSRGAFIGGDLAFSPCHDSAEVWANQDEFDLSRTVGAPPDGFNPKGQRWGLPLPNWNAMRAQGFKVLRQRARHASTLYDLLRIDHVVGLYRTFNFGSELAQPGVFTPVNENDQLAQGEEVIRAIKEEAGATELIAEDLGTVPPWVRASLTHLGVAGYKVMQWERDWGHGDEPFISPSSYPELSLATTGTHDTEPLTVWWRAQPIEVREKLVRGLGLEGKVSPRRMLEEAARDAILASLYAAPSKLAIVPIQDLFGWSAQINRPGTISAWNWTYRIPLPLERMRRSRAIQADVGRVREIAIRSGRFTRDPA